jgi:hypothetical protein
LLSPKSCRPAKRAYTIAKLAVALQGSGNLLQKLIARGGIERASVGSRHHRRPSGAGIEGKHLTYRRPHKQNQIEAH